MDNLFVEIDCSQEKKYSENAYGDCFLCRKIPEEERIIAVLSDGLGSGVKANVLSNMTAHMALKFIASDSDIASSIRIMMDALPVCRTRKISYATFTIVDYRKQEGVRVVEMDNPPLLLMRGKTPIAVSRREIVSSEWKGRRIYLSEFQVKADDRLVFVSDGVTQAGLGTDCHPLGWREEGLKHFVCTTLEHHPDISAGSLSRSVLKAAIQREVGQHPYDDVSCAVMHFRPPRRTMLISGPPFDKSSDQEYARRLLEFNGLKIVCGGTTCGIIERESGNEAQTILGSGGDGVPPKSRLAGIDLVTEGILTLTRTASILENKTEVRGNATPADELADFLRESDNIYFLVGTKINEAHQDPRLPHELEIRRSIIKRIAKALEDNYLKTVTIDYL